MSNNLSYLEKKNIINSILTGLSGTIKSFNITIDNFSIIVIKVMEILKNYPELTPANKYQLSIDILIKIINNLELDEQHQIYLLGTVHSMVFDLSDINTRTNNKKFSNNNNNLNNNNSNNNLNNNNNNLNNLNINLTHLSPVNINQKKLKQMEIEIERETNNSNMNDLQEIVNKLYDLIYDMIISQKMDAVSIPSQLINIVSQTVQLIESYKNLTGIEKKHLVMSAFDKLNDNIDDIFPNLSKEDESMIKLAIKTVPNLIDSIISIISSKYNIHFEEIFNKNTMNFFKNIVNCCKKTED